MLVAQLYPTFCDLMDFSQRGFSVHGICQARILEWVAISFSRISSRPRDQTQVSWIAGEFLTIRMWILYRLSCQGSTLEEISPSNPDSGTAGSVVFRYIQQRIFRPLQSISRVLRELSALSKNIFVGMVMFKTLFFEKINLNGLWPARIFRKVLGTPKQVHTRREGNLQGQKPIPLIAPWPSSLPENEQHREQNPLPTCTGKLDLASPSLGSMGRSKEMNLRRHLAGDQALAST